MKLRFLLAFLVVLFVYMSAKPVDIPVSRELSELQFVRVMGCDSEPDGTVTLSCSVSALSTDKQDKALMLRKNAPSLTEAALKIETFTENTIFFGFNDFMLLGEDAARSGLKQWLDYTERDMYQRLDTSLIVVKGGTAGSVVEAVAADGEPLSPRLDSMEESFGSLPVPAHYSVREVLSQLERVGCAICQAVELAPPEKGDESTDREHPDGGGDKGKTMKPAGYAVFSEGRLAGFIDIDKLAAANILLDRKTIIPLTVDMPEGGRAALLMMKQETEYNPLYGKDELEKLSLDVELSLNLNELINVSIPFDKALAQIEEQVSEKIKDDIVGLLDKSQANGGDWFDLGHSVRYAKPYKWKYTDWKAQFPDLPIEVNVKTIISRTFEINRSMGEEDG
ncbi:MAG: Ger(x)C family spore germination C-terminal domain-containing protein [Oscillospiraceae bacterium]|jgi:spore germination protein KC